MNIERWCHAETLLNDGAVLIIEGQMLWCSLQLRNLRGPELSGLTFTLAGLVCGGMAFAASPPGDVGGILVTKPAIRTSNEAGLWP